MEPDFESPPTRTGAPASASAQGVPPAGTGRRATTAGAVAVLVLVFVVSVAWTWWRTGGEVVPSRDEGAQAVPLLGLVAVAALTLVVTRLVPPRLPTVAPGLRDRPGAQQEVAILGLCAVAFPLTALIPGPPEGYVLWKALLLVLVPAVYLGWRRRTPGPSIEIIRPRHRVPVWLWALVPTALYVGLTHVGPLARAAPTGWPDPVTLAIIATVTAVTAGLVEELFYRYWLQSRLEALAGRWVGILLTSLIFGLMHLGSHGAGLSPDLAVTTVIASQGVVGIVLGYLWSRYRRFWICVLFHVALNGTLVVLYFLGLA